MSERDQILISLVKEVLGPSEVLPEERDPRSEFITGVLEPANAPQVIEPEDDIDEVIEETTAEEDQDNQGFVATPGVFSPALDPKSLPRSIGLSFTIANENGTPAIEICATWARYTHEIDGWHRNPAGFLTGPDRKSTRLNSSHRFGLIALLILHFYRYARILPLIWNPNWDQWTMRIDPLKCCISTGLRWLAVICVERYGKKLI